MRRVISKIGVLNFRNLDPERITVSSVELTIER
jgi:hypothetical protein